MIKIICFINGSPKGINSNSCFLLQLLQKNLLPYPQCYIDISKGKEMQSSLFEPLNQSDIIVVAFPLYVYCVPGLLMQFLEEYCKHYKSRACVNKRSLYAIINCAFPEPRICQEAIEVMKHFCVKAGLDWKFAIVIGNGNVINSIKKVKSLEFLLSDIYEGIKCLERDIKNPSERKKSDMYVIPYSTSLLNVNNGKAKWVKYAYQNGLTEQDLYRTPFKEKLEI